MDPATFDGVADDFHARLRTRALTGYRAGDMARRARDNIKSIERRVGEVSKTITFYPACGGEPRALKGTAPLPVTAA